MNFFPIQYRVQTPEIPLRMFVLPDTLDPLEAYARLSLLGGILRVLIGTISLVCFPGILFTPDF